MALLSSVSTETTGGPKLAIEIDKIFLPKRLCIFLKKYGHLNSPSFCPASPCVSGNISLSPHILKQKVTLTYCPSLDRIASASWSIWRMLSCSQHEPWRSIPAPDPSSHCSDHTSSALFLYTAAPPSSSPFLCCPQHCLHSWERQSGPTQIRG